MRDFDLASPDSCKTEPKPLSSENIDLEAISCQLVRIAASLRTDAFGRYLRSLTDPASKSLPERPANSLARFCEPNLPIVEAARRIYALRRRRGEIFERQIFGEPAWDILLDLFIAGEEGKSVSVSSACIASGVPPTTGLRWLGILCEKGYICRENDDADHRRIIVRLSRKGAKAMRAFLDDAILKL